MKAYKTGITPIVIFLIFFMVDCTSDKKNWESAKLINTITGYENYLIDHPKSEYLDSAQFRIEMLTFQTAKNKNSVEALIQFISDFPNSIYADSTKQFLNSYRNNLIANEDYFIVSKTKMDNYDRVSTIVLSNLKGEEVVSLVPKFNKFNTYQIVEVEMFDIKKNEKIYTTTYDIYERPENAKKLCLDFNGNIIRKNGKVILVDVFKADQKSVSQYKYNGFHRTGTDTKIYPCANCADVLNLPECCFVW